MFVDYLSVAAAAAAVVIIVAAAAAAKTVAAPAEEQDDENDDPYAIVAGIAEHNRYPFSAKMFSRRRPAVQTARLLPAVWKRLSCLPFMP